MGLVSLATVWSALICGVIFGIVPLKNVFLAEGVFLWDCHNENSTDTNLTTALPFVAFTEEKQQWGVDSDGTISCRSQLLHINLMYSIGALCLNVAALPAGILLNRFGPTAPTVIGPGLVALGMSFLQHPSLSLFMYIYHAR